MMPNYKQYILFRNITRTDVHYFKRNINQYSIADFLFKLSYEMWDSVFEGNDVNIILRPATDLSPSFRLAQAIFEPNLYLYKYPNILNHSYSSYLPLCADGTDRLFRNVGI
jgi:hypothetical protein